MNGERDDASLRQYREANAALDERPSPAARAAVLAAAARQVHARPQPADAPRAGALRRWPLAAAATVLLSTLAVMLASRTEQEMPRFDEASEEAREGAAVAPVAPAQQPQLAAPEPVAPAKPDESPAAAAPSPVPPPVPEPTLQGRAQAPARSEMSAPKLKKSAPEAGAESQTMATVPAESLPSRPAPMPSADESPALSKQEDQAPRDRAARSNELERPMAGAAASASPAAPPPAVSPAAPPTGAPAGASTDSMRRDAAPSAEQRALGATQESKITAAKEQDLSAEQWIERIVRLRRDGRHDEADQELKRFRERYPQVQIPPAALPPTATR